MDDVFGYPAYPELRLNKASVKFLDTDETVSEVTLCEPLTANLLFDYAGCYSVRSGVHELFQRCRRLASLLVHNFVSTSERCLHELLRYANTNATSTVTSAPLIRTCSCSVTVQTLFLWAFPDYLPLPETVGYSGLPKTRCLLSTPSSMFRIAAVTMAGEEECRGIMERLLWPFPPDQLDWLAKNGSRRMARV